MKPRTLLIRPESRKEFPVNRNLVISKTLLNLVIFLLALSFEGASPERTAVLVMVFAGLTAWGFVRLFVPRVRSWGLGMDIAFIYLLEYQSKYLVNYFFHILYIPIILEAGISLDRKKANLVAVAAAFAALSKFMVVMKYEFNGATLSQLLFNLFALAFLITLLNYGKLQQEERQKSQLLYNELAEAYRKLKDLSCQKEKAAVLEERNRIARDIHDSLGHRLISLIMQLEMGKQYRDTNPEKMEELLDRCARGAREALTDTRKAVKALKGDENPGIEGILQMINEFRRDTGIDIQADISVPDLTPEAGRVLYRVVQEAITNAVRHGQATFIRVGIGSDGNRISFEVKDNGSGGEYTEGFGIRNMRGRIEELGGTLKIDAGNGFGIMGEFRLRGVRE